MSIKFPRADHNFIQPIDLHPLWNVWHLLYNSQFFMFLFCFVCCRCLELWDVTFLQSWRQYSSCDLGRCSVLSWCWPSCSKKILLWFIFATFPITVDFPPTNKSINDVGKKHHRSMCKVHLNCLSCLFTFIFSSLCIILLKRTFDFFLGVIL